MCQFNLLTALFFKLQSQRVSRAHNVAVATGKVTPKKKNATMSISRLRSYRNAQDAVFGLAKRKQEGDLGYRINPLSGFAEDVEGASVGGGLALLNDIRKRARLQQLRGFLSYYEEHPFVETDRDLVTRDLIVNTFGPFGSTFQTRQHEIVFEYKGMNPLRRGVGEEARFSVVDGVSAPSASSSPSSTFCSRSSERVVFVGGKCYRKDEFKRRDLLWKKLVSDYGIPDHRDPPHRALVTCVSFSSLKRHVNCYANAVRRLREISPATNDMTASELQREVVDRSSRVAADGLEYEAPGIESLFALVEGPEDLFDAFTPLGICHNGELIVRGHPDKRRDLLQVLLGGEGRLLVPDCGYETDDDVCSYSPSMCCDAWLVYRQKRLDDCEGRFSADGSLTTHPDVDLFFTDKPKQKFVEDFVARENHSSHAIRGRPAEPASIIFFFVGTILQNDLGEMGKDDEVVQIQAGMAVHQHRPTVRYPQFVKTI